MTVDITYNDELDGIELRFSEIPLAAIIFEVKKKMQFRFSKSGNDPRWYATKTQQRIDFANELKRKLDNGEDPETISIDVEPSHQPSEENIKHRKFSYVTIYYKDINGNQQTEKYVLFETGKHLAPDIATKFGKKTYGENFEKAYVYPKNYVRESKALLKVGKVIYGTGNKPTSREEVKDQKVASNTIKGSKHSVKKILLTTEAVSRQADFSKAKEIYTWDAANKYVKSLVGQVSDVYYQVHWNDGEIVQGYVDLEPSDNYGNKKDILSNWIFTYFTNLSKHTPDTIASQEDVYNAKRILKNYRFWDFSTDVEDGITWVVYDSKDKIDSLQISEQEAVNYINRRPEFGRDKMRYEQMSTKAAHELWDQEKTGDSEKEKVKTAKTPIQKIILTAFFQLGGKETHGTHKTFYSWEKANEYVKKAKSGDKEYLEYLIEWVDGQVFSGRMDLILLSFDKLNEYVKDYLTSIGKGEILSANNPKDIKGAKVLLDNYSFENSDLSLAEPVNKHTPIPDDGITWVVYDSNGKIDSLQISGEEAKKYIGRRPAFSQDKMSYEQMTTKKAYQLFDEQKLRRELTPEQLTTKHKLEILGEFKRSLDNKKLDVSGDELRMQFGHWFRNGYSNISSEEESVWQEYETVKSITNPDPNKSQIPESDYRLFFIKFREYAKAEVGQTTGSASMEAFMAWLEENYTNITTADKEGLKKYYADFIKKLENTSKQIENLSKPKKQQPYSGNYTKMLKLAPKLLEHLDQGYTHGLSSHGAEIGNMHVSLNVLYKDSKGAYIMALSHFYKEHGELKTDLDMEIRLDPHLEMVEALTYQDGLGVFQKVYHEEDEKMLVNTKLKKQLNTFLRTWLTNILDSKHKIVWSEDSKEESRKSEEPLTQKIGNSEIDLPHIKVDQKKQNNHELNQEIEKFISGKDLNNEEYTIEDKEYISQYSGSGGLAKKGASGKGLLYEYYTPDEIVRLMWGLASKYGYTNGAVLEPSCGTGNFLKYVPAQARSVGFETNPTARRIAQILYPNATVIKKPFESFFFKGNVHLKDDFNKSGLFDLVIGNPPYGDFSGKYAGMGEKKWTKATKYEEYFITRGLDLLKPGGLLIYIIPSSFLKTGLNKVKEKIAEKSEPLLDAYWLPSGMFSTTGIGTDIVVFKRK